MTGTLPTPRRRRAQRDADDDAAAEVPPAGVRPGASPGARRRRLLRLIGALLLALVAAGAVVVSFTGLPSTGSGEQVELLTAKVERGNARTEVAGSGTVEPTSTLELSFGTSSSSSATGGGAGAGTSTASAAVVTAVHVSRGDRVERGQVLARLDRSSAGLALQSAQRSYEAAVAARDEPATTTRDGSTTQDQSDEQLELAVAEAEVALEQARRDLAATVIRSPRAATVQAVDVAVGEQPPTDAAAITLRSGGMRVVVDVAEDDINAVERNQRAEVRIVALDATVSGTVTSVDAEDDSSSTGTSSTSPGGASSGSSAVTFPVAVTLEKVPAGLRSGMSAEVTIVTASADDVLVVPLTAIGGSGDGAFARVPDGDGGVEQVQVALGLVAARVVEVRSGLEEGDEVVTGIVRAEDEEGEGASGSSSLLGGGGGMGGPPGGFAGGAPPGGGFPGGGAGQRGGNR